MTHPHVLSGLRRQLEDWRAALDRGADRVGWKIGLNIPEVQRQLGIDGPVIGHLTSATVVESGGTYSGGDAERLMAEPEVAVELGDDVQPDADADASREAIAGLAPALELVDTGRPPEGVEEIVAGNAFHRAAVIGPSRAAFGQSRGGALIRSNGDQREVDEVPDDFSDVVMVTARLLGEVGERLQAGDRIIAGALTPQLPAAVGDEVSVEIDGLGGVQLRIAP